MPGCELWHGQDGVFNMRRWPEAFRSAAACSPWRCSCVGSSAHRSKSARSCRQPVEIRPLAQRRLFTAGGAITCRRWQLLSARAGRGQLRPFEHLREAEARLGLVEATWLPRHRRSYTTWGGGQAAVLLVLAHKLVQPSLLVLYRRQAFWRPLLANGRSHRRSSERVRRELFERPSRRYTEFGSRRRLTQTLALSSTIKQGG
eukprot:scaffold86455_cov63-Phaeocystis_antarctica.AAC.3